MSASMDTGNFRRYFAGRSAEMKVAGRTHPVEIIHHNQSRLYSTFGKCEAKVYWEMAVAKVAEVHQREKEGDILLFMTGEDVGAIRAKKIQI
jgi:HrpA-like RNA helicase